MKDRNASAPARPVGRTLTAISKTIGQTAILTVALATASASMALAQQPVPAPVAPAPKPKPPAAPKPAARPPAAAPAAQQPAAPAAPPDQGQAQGQPQGGDQQQQVQLIYSPWTKFCLKANQNDPNSKQVCFTGKDARIESGMPVVAAVLIEPEGEPKKILRVTLPLGMQLIHGTRLIIDQNQPLTAPYVICFTNGCMADYEATPDMIAKMKKGKAYDGPPTDPKVFEEQQQKLQEELQKRADDARKRLEQQQGGAPQSSNGPAPQQ